MIARRSLALTDQRRSSAGMVWALLTAVFSASLLLPLPQNGQIAHLPSICLFYNLTGLPCPACGLTRSFVCLSHGQWHESLLWHPLGWLVFGGLLLLWVRCSVFWLRGTLLFPLSPQTAGRLSFLSSIILVLTGIARIGWLTVHHLHF